MKEKKGSSFKSQKFLIFAFLFVLIVIGFFTFFNDFSLTGNLIQKGNQNGSLDLDGTLTVPYMNLNSEYDEVSILAGGENSFIEVENLKLDLFGSSQIVLKGFDGKIEFDDEKIYMLRGSAEQVSVNGEVLSSEEDSTKVELEKDFSYSELSIKNNAFLRRLDYVTSGNLKLNGNNFILNNESLKIRSFYGSFISKEGEFEIGGSVDSLEINGNSRIVVN